MTTRARTGNAADPEQVTRAGKADRRDAEDAAEDMRLILSTLQGRRFLWTLMGQCGVTESVFVAESDRVTYYRAGKQDLGHLLMAQSMEASLDGWLLMQKEAAQRKNLLPPDRPSDPSPDLENDANA